jgi:hypothetical protein
MTDKNLKEVPMSRGLSKIMSKWAKGNETELAVVRELQTLEQMRAAPKEFLPILSTLQSRQMLSSEAVF